MTPDDLEFSISQYLDGTLAEPQRDTLETRLGSDAEARALFAEYEALQAALANAPLPAVRWDRLAGQISAAVAREEMPAQSYRLSNWLRPARLGLAASVLVAAGVVFALFRQGDPGTPAPDAVATTGRAAPIQIVVKPASPAAAQQVVASSPEAIQVAIGPPPASADGPVFVRAQTDSVVRRPSKAVIVSAARVGQDNPHMPF